MKKIVSVVLAITLVMTCCLAAYGAEGRKFYDVSSKHWANKYITAMNTRGVVNGYPDGSFGPDKGVSRSEFATMLCLSADIKYSKPSQQIYNDVPTNDWCAQFVHAVKKYMPGYSKDGKSYYEPNSPALREDITVALIKVIGYPVANADVDKLEDMFYDYDEISNSAKPYVAIAVEMGIVSGYNDGTFRGDNGVTRAEAVTLLYNASKYFNSSRIASDKPYSVRKIASANIGDFGVATTFGTMDLFNNLYYIDSKDSCVYKIDLNTFEKTKYYNPSKLKHEVEGEYEFDGEEGTGIMKTYSSYVPYQVYYDSVNNKLLLNGYYKNLVEAGKSPKNGEYHFIYSITGDSAELYCQPDWYYNGSYNEDPITAVLNEDYFVLGGSNYGHKIEIETGTTDKIHMCFEYVGGLKYGNSMFGYAYEKIYQYNFNEDDYETISGFIDADSFATKDDSYYFWNNEDGSIFKISVRSKMTTVLDANTKSENVEFKDMGNMKNIADQFFVIDDSTFVFYDKKMKAFRMLERN